jgi:hypothetical protein
MICRDEFIERIWTRPGATRILLFEQPTDRQRDHGGFGREPVIPLRGWPECFVGPLGMLKSKNRIEFGEDS